MGKHSIKKEKKNFNKKRLLIILVLIILIVAGVFIIQNTNLFKSKNNTLAENLKTVEGEKLVLKSNSDYNKIIEYIFDNDKLKTVKIYEQFEKEDKYKEKKDAYNLANDINVIKTDDKDLLIEIEKKDLGTDEGLSYEQLYDKYIVRLIDIYTVV